MCLNKKNKDKQKLFRNINENYYRCRTGINLKLIFTFKYI